MKMILSAAAALSVYSLMCLTSRQSTEGGLLGGLQEQKNPNENKEFVDYSWMAMSVFNNGENEPADGFRYVTAKEEIFYWDDHKAAKEKRLMAIESTPVFKHMLRNEKDRLHWQKFTTFLSKFNKTYNSKSEYLLRFDNFRKNLAVIKDLQKNEKGSAHNDITQFADVSQEEFRSNVLIPRRTNTRYPDVLGDEMLDSSKVPDSWDWRDHGAVTPVKNQGDCGSCWAFAVIGNIEGQWAIKRGKLVNLSEQELVDCDRLDYACLGGNGFPDSYQEVMRLGGLEPEQDYPYDEQMNNCTFNKSKAHVSIDSYVKIDEDEELMKFWLYKYGPIAVSINEEGIQEYTGGIALPSRSECDPDNLNHAVLIVGYGVNGTLPFWIIKNSWGANWGDKGYWYVLRGQGICGLNKQAYSAIIY